MERNQVRARRSAAAGVALAVLAALTVLVAPLADAPAGAAGSAFALTDLRATVVDPASGRVFVAGDDRVLAFAADGTPVGTVDDVPGAGGMAFAGGSLWVVATEDDAIVEVDPTTLAVVDEHPTGLVRRSIVAVGGKLLFVGVGNAYPYYSLKVLDPATDAITSRGTIDDTLLVAIPGSTDRLLVGEDDGTSPYTVALYDIGANPVVRLAAVPHGLGSNLRGAVATEQGTFVTAAGAPYRFDEISTTPEGSTLEPTGVVYPGTYYPAAIDYTPAAGGVLAATTSSTNQLWVAARGIPRPTQVTALPGEPLQWGVALAPDASAAYTITKAGTGSVALTVHRLAPVLGSVSTSTVARGATTRVVVNGAALGSIRTAKLGGQPVAFAADGTGRLELEVTTALADGAASLVLDGPLGSITVPMTVAANPAATVRGTVTSGGAPVAGAAVQLTDQRGTARTTTTTADGTWSLTGVGNGAHQDIRVTFGSASHAWRDQTVQGTGTQAFDVDLLSPPATTAQVRRFELPPGDVRRLISDPTTGRTFVAVGDEIVVFDADGRLVGRVAEQWTASDLQVVGSKLYVMQQRAGRYSVIDTSTLAVTKTVPVRRLNDGSFRIAGGRVFFTDGDQQWTPIVSMDLTTGTLATNPGSYAVPTFGPIEGQPDGFITWEPGAFDLVRWTVSGGTATAAATSPWEARAEARDVVGSAAAGKAWSARGTEYDLATLTPTGTAYPAGISASVAWSPGRGGVLAFGARVSRQGSATTTHVLPAEPTARSSVLDAAGGRSTVATADGFLVLADLAPVVTAVAPAPVYVTPSDLAVTGSGLGATTAVTVDGKAATFAVTDAGRITVDLPALGRGAHRLAVTTPWGTSPPFEFAAGAPFSPFSSWSELVTRLYTDLTAAAPSAAAASSWVSQLEAGTKDPGDLVEALRRGTDNTNAVDPVARLYRAFLGRTPDASGLRFWVNRKRAGTWTVTRMADSFATSTEFTRKYGALTNRAFVTRIYTDVMGRSADPSGVAYWTGKLDRRQKTRGQVMVGFSESSEYRRKQAENTDVAIAYVYLLGRAPTAGEVSGWVGRQKAGTPQAVLADELLASLGYRLHIEG